MQSIPQNNLVQFTLFTPPESSTVTCLVCGKQLQRIGNLHLNMHGMTTSDYKVMFPGASFVSESMRDKHRTRIMGNKQLGGSVYKPRSGVTKNCEVCGKPFYVIPSEIKRARFCSKQCLGKMKSGPNGIYFACARYGSDNPQWRGGRDKNYYGPNWHQQRRSARKRDNDTCQKCGKTERDNGRKLDVHHIQDFREFGIERYQEANQLSNLISLCRCCHSHITSGIATWPPSSL